MKAGDRFWAVGCSETQPKTSGPAAAKQTTAHTRGGSDMLRIARFAAGILVGSLILALPFLHSHADTSTNTVSVIVEFKGDPAAVYASKLKQQGAAVSSDQIQSYRNQLAATQNQFLSALKVAVPTAQLQSEAVKDVSGNVAGNVAMRYSLVYNGMALALP